MTGVTDRARIIQEVSEAQRLAAFEALVQAQQPTSQPWTPVTDYSFEARKQIEGAHPRLIVDTFGIAVENFCDVGAGAGHLVTLLREVGAGGRAHVALDLHPAPGVFRYDVSKPHSAANHVIAAGFDLVICREVLEHLTIRQIRQAVTNVCLLSSRFVYVTTRFCRAPQHLLDVDTADDLDPTHITMLNQSLLRLLFVLEGFTRRADLEQKLDWQHQGRCLVYERP